MFSLFSHLGKREVHSVLHKKLAVCKVIAGLIFAKVLNANVEKG